MEKEVHRSFFFFNESIFMSDGINQLARPDSHSRARRTLPREPYHEREWEKNLTTRVSPPCLRSASPSEEPHLLILLRPDQSTRMAESVYTIEVTVDGFFNKQDDRRKVYVKGRTLKWVVDSERFSLCDFNSELAMDLGLGKHQISKIWIVDKMDGSKAELVSESQILEIFKMYEKERLIFLHVVVCDLDANATYPCTPVQPTPDIEIGSQSQEGSKYGEARLNDEHIYDSASEDDRDESHREGIVHHEAIMTYDPENPKIEIGASFPDVATFRKALRHFAIKNEFEIGDIKTDKKRFRGKCAHPSCPWRIHASIIKKTQACVEEK